MSMNAVNPDEYDEFRAGWLWAPAMAAVVSAIAGMFVAQIAPSYVAGLWISLIFAAASPLLFLLPRPQASAKTRSSRVAMIVLAIVCAVGAVIACVMRLYLGSLEGAAADIGGFSSWLLSVGGLLSSTITYAAVQLTAHQQRNTLKYL